VSLRQRHDPPQRSQEKERRAVFHDPSHWFPNALVANLFAVLLIGFLLLDTILQARGARQRSGPTQQRADQGSLVIVNGSLILAFLIAAGCRYLTLGVVPGWVQYVGIVGMVLGFVLREWSVLTLGAFFSKVVEIEQDHQLITTGPYQRLRHPAYTGLLLFFTATALALGTWIGAAHAFVVIFLALRYRIGVEERLLEETFGSTYHAYAQRTWRLFPGW
jgi:protein-S-isoprenylcysteine O-methyltransferase Ste14